MWSQERRFKHFGWVQFERSWNARMRQHVHCGTSISNFNHTQFEMEAWFQCQPEQHPHTSWYFSCSFGCAFSAFWFHRGGKMENTVFPPPFVGREIRILRKCLPCNKFHHPQITLTTVTSTLTSWPVVFSTRQVAPPCITFPPNKPFPPFSWGEANIIIIITTMFRLNNKATTTRVKMHHHHQMSNHSIEPSSLHRPTASPKPQIAPFSKVLSSIDQTTIWQWNRHCHHQHLHHHRHQLPTTPLPSVPPRTVYAARMDTLLQMWRRESSRVGLPVWPMVSVDGPMYVMNVVWFFFVPWWSGMQRSDK